MSAGPAIVLLTHPLAALTSGTGVPLALAFGAGLLATLNPCGFALLPAYVSYVVGQDTANRKATAWAQTLRGGLLGLPLAAGFLLVFVVAGGVLAAGGRLLAHLFPWVAILVGLGLVALGGWTLLSGRIPEIPGLVTLADAVGRPRTPAQGRSDARVEAQGRVGDLRAAWAFGLGYGLSSLGCTLPVFLLVVGSAVAASGWVSALLVLAAYAAGMLLVLLAVAMAASTLRDLLRQYVMPLLRWVQPMAALLVIAAGVYIVIYQLRAGLW
jgi:cytochrome c-type biogenesis protein